MNNNKTKRLFKIIIATVFWIIIWEAASLLISDSLKMFLPGPFEVIKAFFGLIIKSSFWHSAGLTLLRIISGFALGSIIGILLAFLTTEFEFLNIILSPALRIIRAVPVVSFIILAFLFIDVNRLPVFISSLMVIPLVWQNVYDGIINTDIKLYEMADVYGVGRFKKLLYIKIPSVLNIIISSLINAIGIAWKSGVAAEVLCTPEISIGKSIYRAKGNLDFAGVYALTLTVVILSLVFEFTVKYLWKKSIKGKEQKKNDRV